MERTTERLELAARERANASPTERVADDPTHKQKAIYSLTEKGIELLPIVVQIGAWGSKWVPDAKKLDAASRKFLRELQEGGPRAWEKRMEELRAGRLR
jgi:DNA-binding PadR family transcriptional regulator